MRRTCIRPVDSTSACGNGRGRGRPRDSRRDAGATLLFALWRDVAGGQGGALAEEEIFHVLDDDLLRLFVGGVEAVLVEDHLAVLLPELAGLERNVVEDALAEGAVE